MFFFFFPVSKKATIRSLLIIKYFASLYPDLYLGLSCYFKPAPGIIMLFQSSKEEKYV
jgi:hypothetical protein